MLLKYMKNWSKKSSYIYSFLLYIKQNWENNYTKKSWEYNLQVYLNPFEINVLLTTENSRKSWEYNLQVYLNPFEINVLLTTENSRLIYFVNELIVYEWKLVSNGQSCLK